MFRCNFSKIQKKKFFSKYSTFLIIKKCGESSTTNAQKAVSEVCRVLGPAGVYIVVSYGQPEHRLMYLDRVDYILFNNEDSKISNNNKIA